ncbi:MFS transporter [Comamonas serinivorans]|uniref:MFS transporter n=2 Tax=Comamonas serinivorans TaxID=1082851 RepID=A0A1Y0ETU8_9BURK|nr:MFS transporter [Comamonas serinivorans]
MATLSGVGLSRFAYTALLPQVVHAGWFTGEQAAYIGAANLLGYLVGALAAAPLADRWPAKRVLLAAWLVVTVSFLAECVAQPMSVFFFWRCAAGVAGGVLMVLGPSLAMAATPVARRATLGPMMFCGIGFGALISASLVPALASLSLSAAWLALAAVCGLATWVGWRALQRLDEAVAPVVVAGGEGSKGESASAGQTVSVITPHLQAAAMASTWTLAVVLLLLAYMTDGFGFVPHTVFWADYLARELNLGTGYASAQWAFFGLGAIVGPLTLGLAASRWGWWRVGVAAFALKALAIGLPLWGASAAVHAVSGLLVGALSPGMSAVVSGYLMQLIGPAQHKRMWGLSTAGFSLTQAASGALMAWLYTQLGAYRPLFAIGCAALWLGCAMVVAMRWCRPARLA